MLDIPRVPLARLPTPLVEARGLTDALGGPHIYVKRDDETGLAFGGNKVRKLEYLLGQAKAQGADTIVATGAYQSNMVRLAAAAARVADMEPVLVLGGLEGERRNLQGNLLLDHLLGATLHFVEGPDRWDLDDAVQRVNADLERSGRKPYTLPLGGSTPEGTTSYVMAALELHRQLWEMDVQPTHLVLATGTGGTQAGLEVGARMLGAPWQILGISVSRSSDVARAKVRLLMQQLCARLGVPYEDPGEDLVVLDDYIGPGYSLLSDEAAVAIRQVARSEGILLDPVYTGKAMAGLMDQIRLGRIGAGDTVVFLHTGGLPALFAHGEGLGGAP